MKPPDDEVKGKMQKHSGLWWNEELLWNKHEWLADKRLSSVFLEVNICY